MYEFLKVAIGVAVGFCLAPIVFVFAIKGPMDDVLRLEAYYRAEYDYLFEAANERGLLEICDADQRVSFKSDCPRRVRK